MWKSSQEIKEQRVLLNYLKKKKKRKIFLGSPKEGFRIEPDQKKKSIVQAKMEARAGSVKLGA